VPFDEPTLLAVHFTLVHWPYTWASTPPEQQEAPMPEKYQRAVERVDRQFGDLLGALREGGALDNAIVVLLSDHGESMGEPLTVAADEHARRHIRNVDEAVGHGTSVFAREQYQVLLAMRSFGADELPTTGGTTIAGPASVEDITPTLADALGLQARGAFDGTSWLPELRGTATANRTARFRFMETEFSPPGFASGVNLTRRNLRSAAAYYRVDAETDRVLIRPELLPRLLTTRQYAVVRGEELLAAVPAESAQEQRVLYIESPGSTPVWFSTPPTATTGAPYELWNALSGRFAYVRERAIVPPLEDAD
jgi:hypothetical protein